MKGLLPEFFEPGMKGTKFLTFANARRKYEVHFRSLKLSARLSFLFTIFWKLSAREVVLLIPRLLFQAV